MADQETDPQGVDPQAVASQSLASHGGDAHGGDARGGDARGGDARGGDPRGDDPRRGHPRRGDPRRGHPPVADPPGSDPPGSDPQHVRAEHYLRGVVGRRSAAGLACRTHDHLVGRCPQCRRAWRSVAPHEERFYARLTADGATRRPPLPSADDPARLPGDADTLARLAPEVARQRGERERAQRDLWDLRRLPAARRAARIRNARVRFSSRALVELLIEESRARVRTAPLEAAEWARLAPRVIARMPAGDDGLLAALRARAAAHHANAVRVSGDLTAAARQLIELRCDLAEQPVDELAVLAEVASLEASLAIDQRQFAVAEELLDRARLLYAEASSREGLARVLVQQGLLQRATGNLDQAVDRLGAAASLLDTERDAYLLLSTVNTRIRCLCDLGRAADAERLLVANRPLYEASDDAHVGSVVRNLEGRIALDLGRFGLAIERLEASREGFLLLDRTYDAILVSLDLACACHAAGEWPRLERLAAGLVPQFRARGVSRETLAALGLVARAVAARRLTRQVLDEIRRRVQDSLRSSPAA